MLEDTAEIAFALNRTPSSFMLDARLYRSDRSPPWRTRVKREGNERNEASRLEPTLTSISRLPHPSEVLHSQRAARFATVRNCWSTVRSMMHPDYGQASTSRHRTKFNIASTPLVLSYRRVARTRALREFSDLPGHCTKIVPPYASEEH